MATIQPRNPVQIFNAGADEQKQENARIVPHLLFCSSAFFFSFFSFLDDRALHARSFQIATFSSPLTHLSHFSLIDRVLRGYCCR